MTNEKTLIRVNLNPNKDNIPSLALQKLISFTPLLGVGLVVVTIALLVLQIFILKMTYSYNISKRNWKKWEDKFNITKKIKSEISELEVEKENLQEIITPEYKISLVLENIFSSLPENIWFEKLNFKEGFINIKGYVVKWEEDYLISLDKFMNHLQSKEYFSKKFNNVSLKKSKKAQFSNVEILEFSIQCEN